MAALPEEWEAAPEPGWVDPVLAEEFPGLSISRDHPRRRLGPQPRRRSRSGCASSATASAALRRSSCASGRSPGPTASSSVTSASTPTRPRPRSSSWRWTACATAAFGAENRLDDALTIAIAEVGVALLAFDADRVEGRLGLRLSVEGERFEGRALAAARGHDRDRRRAAAPRGALRPDRRGERGSTSRTERTALVAIGVKGVPDIALEEALWLAASAMHA